MIGDGDTMGILTYKELTRKLYPKVFLTYDLLLMNVIIKASITHFGTIYFIKTWAMDYEPKFWNVHAFTKDTEKLINRTQNPVERYNRHLNEILPVHPSVPTLV